MDADLRSYMTLQTTEQHRGTTHIVTFPEPVTLEAFRAYCERRNWFGFHPAGYGGWCRVNGNVGTYSHYSTCD